MTWRAPSTTFYLVSKKRFSGNGNLRAMLRTNRGRRAIIHRPLAAQLLGNLIDNACKHSSPGTPIILRLTQTAEAVRLEIADRGAGIAPSELPHVFEPFYRSRDARNRGLPGAGLGLAVAQRIATALGGRLSVESPHGAGSRFELLLPRHDAPPGDGPSG